MFTAVANLSAADLTPKMVRSVLLSGTVQGGQRSHVRRQGEDNEEAAEHNSAYAVAGLTEDHVAVVVPGEDATPRDLGPPLNHVAQRLHRTTKPRTLHNEATADLLADKAWILTPS